MTKNTGSWYLVQTETESLECRIKGKFRLKGIRSTNPVAVGDRVDVDPENNTIIAIHDRKNYLVRKATNLSKQTHIIAANIDQAVLVATVSHPVTTTVFIDRFLSTAEAYDIPAKLIFNKTDLYNDKETDTLAEWLAIYSEIGYECFFTSVVKNRNIDKVAALLSCKVSLLSGHSGVGKSSLINAIDPDLKLKTQEISDAHHSGKHTTTFSEMHALKLGGYIIDTPGIRGFGTIDFERNEIYHFFPEIFKVAAKCKYHNCIHVEEPGCAVKEAVEEGEISYSRYVSYLNILEDPDDNKYRV
ncbi:ribosome small subunit-dependent GTPase A [Saccharicrinis sp. FJH62]|uniref:ribosome small subunit-dependent GTPase A n=1 Tax=Saccharicrinis sp. FJH62 TaxID=3344657 RepID=UPI0035D47153